MNVTKELKLFLEVKKTLCEKGENAGYQPAFSPLPTMFSNVFFLTVVKSWSCMVKS